MEGGTHPTFGEALRVRLQQREHLLVDLTEGWRLWHDAAIIVVEGLKGRLWVRFPQPGAART